MMSRLGSFPLRTATWALNRFGEGRRTVLDPFCGKGTSLFAARILGAEAYGIDVAPEAVVCAKAKLTDVTLPGLETYLRSVRLGRPSLSATPTEVKTFFHPTTLQQIISLRRHLQRSIDEGPDEQRSIAITLLAALLGILHGHASYSLSISSAHAYAMSPNYVRRYARAHGLRAPERNVKDCLMAKLRKCFAKPMPDPVAAKVLQGRAQDTHLLFPELLGRVDCILTSPPYLASHTYAKDNWLRQWLLGFNYKAISSNYLQTGSIARYTCEMKSVLQSVAAVLKPGGTLILIVGHGRNGNSAAQCHEGVNMQNLFRTMLSAEETDLTLENVVTEQVESQKRYYHALSTTNGHNANVRREYVLVARKRST